MTKRQKSTIPSITFHKATGQARVRLSGKDHYLGTFGTPEAVEAYHRIVGEWLMNGRSLPDSKPKRRSRHTTTTTPDDSGVEVLTVGELVSQYLKWARIRYAKSNHASVNEYGLKPLIDGYSSLPADQFSPNKLRIVRQLMIQRGWVRTNINHHVSTVRSVFAWAVGRELIPDSVHSALCKVEPLAFGSPGVRESSKKELVPDGVIESLRPFLSGQVYAIIQLMWLSGARCGEICQVRPADLKEVETDGVKILEFTPGHHKTAHKGFSRIIRFGPVGMMILQPFLNRPADEYCFSPAEAEIERRDKAHEARVTPPSYGNTIGSNRKPKPQRKPGAVYSTAVIRRAITRAIHAHNKQHPQEAIERFSPHALRHTSLTRMRNQFGMEAAMSMAGHHSPSMVDLYTSRSSAAARRVAMEAG